MRLLWGRASLFGRTPFPFSGAQYHRDGRVQDIADYCESDVMNSYRIWLRYEYFADRSGPPVGAGGWSQQPKGRSGCRRRARNVEKNKGHSEKRQPGGI